MDYTAHIREDGKTQSVSEHCKGVADKAEEYARSISAGSIARLQGILHDVGKLTDDFNNYINGDPKFSRGEIDHSFAGARYICEAAEKIDKKAYHEVSALIARTIISHHGLHDWIDDNGNDYFKCRISKSERYDSVLEHISEFISENDICKLLQSANEEYCSIIKNIKNICMKNRTNFSFYLGMLERFMQSVLIDADRTDTADFMSGKCTEKSFDTQKLWNDMQLRIENKISTFSEKTDKISLQRQSISQRYGDFANADRKTEVCRLVVPTGGGKTLSSLRFAIRYCKIYKKEHIFYIAPFMSILEQNGDIIKEIAGKENFLEHYSNILSDIENDSELNEYELRTEKWDSPVIATTMVQFLNTLFSGKNSSVRRMHRLGNSVIIIDEAQSIPMKCIHIFNLAINFLTKICGSTVVLCTATQPAFEKTAYRLLVDGKSSMTGDYSKDFEVFKRTEIIPKLKPYKYSNEEAADFCIEHFKENGSLLLIVNTKSEAFEMYRLIKEKCKDTAEIIHLSANMCSKHRRDRISEMRKMLDEERPVICITTQLIEAGVDISFKCAVRSIAGMDNIAQAAGRCNRHGESNGICPVYIINLKDEKLGNLKSIKNAAQVSCGMIDSGSFQEYLSVETMTAYYEKLYCCNKDELSYNVNVDSSEKTTLLNLLSLNKDRNLNKINEFSAQAFKTAGSLFKVIDDNAVDIIVPYNEEAEKLIEELDSLLSPDETLKRLRMAQKYTVSIYKGTNVKLDDKNALYTLKCSAYALKKEFYDPECGVNAQEDMLKEILIY